MEPIEIIRVCKIFKEFPEEFKEELAKASTVISYKANDIIFEMDDDAHSLAILMKGRVDIMTTKRTQLIPFHTIYPGEAFALSSMITGKFHSSAKAVDDSQICAIPVDKMEKVLERDYRLAYMFMKQIAILVSTRLLKMHYHMDIAGSGYM